MAGIGAATVKRMYLMVIVSIALLSGCGNKGALYLPDQADPSAPKQQTPAEQPQPAQY
jgi:predicted small lipoprotein YifL